MKKTLALMLVPLWAQAPGVVWEISGFEAFRKGLFDSGGTNLYVSRQGSLQTIHRWDLNSDGAFDLIFNNTHDLVYVPPAYEYRFQGRQPDRREFPGAGSVRVLAADLDGDGYAELAIARGFDNTTRVQNSAIYWGTPAGWSGRRHIELPSPYVQDLCVADFNGDGRPDLAFIASGGAGVNTTWIYWGRPAGYAYLDRTGVETPGANGCLAADLDGDGAADLMITAGTRGAAVFWSGGQERSGIDVRGAVGAQKLGSRVVIATETGPKIYALRGRAFQLEQQVEISGAARVAVADLNRDGIPDLVVARTMHQRNWEISSLILWGASSGYSAEHSTELPTIGAVDAAVADLDGDGWPDIAFANSRSYRSFDVPSYVYWGGPEGYSFARHAELPTHGTASVSTHGRSVFFANAVEGRVIGDIDTYVYMGAGERGFSAKRMLKLPTIGGYESCAADLNDDGWPDLLLVGSHEGDLGGPAGSYIYWGGAAGFSTERRSEVRSRGAIGCAIGDVNRDGYLDLLFANMDDNTLSILFGGAEGFGKEQTLQVAEPRFPMIADVNGDGYVDLLAPSLVNGLEIFWGSEQGYRQANRTTLPGVGTVSAQAADLNRDGYLDLVVCNLVDQARNDYHTVNTYIYWGSQDGYRITNRTELPSLGAHHAAVADFNRDGYLDIFISNYQSEFSRDLDSHIYWGDKDGGYSPARRQALHVGSAAGVVAGDFNGDGWIDLAVSNHMANGDHHSRSPVFWNGPGGFNGSRATWLPTVGPHMMAGVDPGNVYSRAPNEAWESAAFDAGRAVRPRTWQLEGATPHGSRLELALRAADTQEGLRTAAWAPLAGRPPQSLERRRWWQSRVTLHSSHASSPSLRRMRIEFGE